MPNKHLDINALFLFSFMYKIQFGESHKKQLKEHNRICRKCF